MLIECSGIHSHHPIAVPFETPTSEREIEFNNEFASYRTVVENVICHIREWSICGNLFCINDTNDLETLGSHHCNSPP